MNFPTTDESMIHLKSNGVDSPKSINVLGSRIYLIAPLLSEKINFCSPKKQLWLPKSSNLTAQWGGGALATALDSKAKN